MAAPDVLDQLVAEGIIDAVRARLMSGKEASVFVVERHGELLAAKVYKDRDERTFSATASYTEGRNQTRNSRDRRAIGKRSAYGKNLVEKNWRDMEYGSLADAYAAGVRVPEPVLLYENVLLMELLVDENGAPAPRLADFDLPADVAELLHREIYGQVRKLLASGKIHGDLSAFNILIAKDGPTLIDMPQVVDASANNNAEEILRRDLCNVTEHLARFDARLLRFRDCGSALWSHYRRGDIDAATEPQEGGVRREGGRGRRARDAERGRMGRGNSDRQQRPAHGQHHHGHEQRPPRPQNQQYDQRPPRPHSQQHDQRPPRPQNQQHDQRPHDQPRGERPAQQRDERPTQRPAQQRDQHRDPRPAQQQEQHRDQRPAHQPDRRPRDPQPRDQRPAHQPDRQPRDPQPRDQRPAQPRDPQPRDPQPRDPHQRDQRPAHQRPAHPRDQQRPPPSRHKGPPIKEDLPPQISRGPAAPSAPRRPNEPKPR